MLSGFSPSQFGYGYDAIGLTNRPTNSLRKLQNPAMASSQRGPESERHHPRGLGLGHADAPQGREHPARSSTAHAAPQGRSSNEDGHAKHHRMPAEPPHNHNLNTDVDPHRGDSYEAPPRRAAETATTRSPSSPRTPPTPGSSAWKPASRSTPPTPA